MLATRKVEVYNDDREIMESMEEEGAELEDSQAEEDEQMDEENYSEGSDASDEVVDASSLEDMKKFQETFTGLSEKYRIISKIGEGKFSSILTFTIQLNPDRHFFYCLQSRRSLVRWVCQRMGLGGEGNLQMDVSSCRVKPRVRIDGGIE